MSMKKRSEGGEIRAKKHVTVILCCLTYAFKKSTLNPLASLCLLRLNRAESKAIIIKPGVQNGYSCVIIMSNYIMQAMNIPENTTFAP